MYVYTYIRGVYIYKMRETEYERQHARRKTTAKKKNERQKTEPNDAHKQILLLRYALRLY
jgi:hypothetical protein